MRIQRLEIYGYGKWVDTSFDLAEDVHLFYGENEAGKSTLMSFIHSILFGFPTRNSAFLRYEPRESSRYGGKIIAEDARFGEVIIERIHGKVTGDVTVTLEDGTTGSDELLESVMYGLDRDIFQNIFSFSLTEIENVHRLHKNQLSRYLLNIGAHGTEYYLELVDQFRTEADKLYRPSGRVLDLNKQLTILEKQEERLAALEKRNESYLGLIEKNKEQNEAIQTLEIKQKNLEQRRADLTEFKKKWHVLEEIQTLEQEIAAIHLPPLKEDGRYLLEEYKRNRAKLTEQLQALEDKQAAQKETLADPEMIDNYEENQAAVYALENELPEIIEEMRDYEAITDKRLETQKTLTQIERELGIEHNTQYPPAFSEQEKAAVKNWASFYEDSSAKYQKMTTELQASENELSLKNQKLDQYEAMMWDNQELKQAEEQLNHADPAQEPVKQTNSLLIGGIGLLAAIGAFFVAAPVQWLLGLVAVVAFVFAGLMARKNTQTATPASSNEFLEKEYEKQLVLKEEWRESLGAVDSMQATFQQQLEARDTLLKQQQEVVAQWQEMLAQHDLPTTSSLEQAAYIFEKTAQLQQLLTQDQQQNQKQTELREQLEAKTAPIADIIELPATISLAEKVAQFRQYLAKLKTTLTQEQEKINQLNALKQEARQLEARIQSTEEKIRNLIEMADVETEEEFLALYAQKEQYEAKQSRLRFLKENVPAFDSTKDLPTKEELATQEQQLETQLEALEAEKGQAFREQANTELSIENLEKDGTYTEELQAFENQKAIAQRLVDEWVSYKLAAGMIQETLNGVTQDRFQEIIADAETYFRLLTDGEYERIVFKEEKLFVQLAAGQVVDVRALSRGTAEPLYVAIRLAYIKNTQDMIELPIIMDDPFVNFDRERQQNMYRLLETLSADLQIIYFTFDPEAKAYFTEKQITNLNEEKK
jgi:uncharacterized protein YhaN